MKKSREHISHSQNGFVLNVMGSLKRLEKGMSKSDVISILGSPQSIEQCTSSINEKLNYKISINAFSSTRYLALFTNDTLVYITKIK